MIVATAGHIDHGKTALVRALTQIDTDRLKEEKQRGLSIDLGFAYADVGAGLPLGFVDVPGHERFIRNMLAGVAGVDFALLVVAADDGLMPQTLEHLAILDLLGLAQGAVALTKTDRATPDRVRALGDDIRALLAPTSLADAAIYPVSAATGDGIPALQRHLTQRARAQAWPPPRGGFRFTVDRSFTLKGSGCVVTGTALAGALRTGESVIVSPEGITARARSLHVHNAPADAVVAGQRCAINLAGPVHHESIRRGDWLVAPHLHHPTERLDVTLRLLAAETRKLKHWAPVQLYLGAAVRNGRVALLERTSLAPGEQGLAQLVLDQPVQAAAGDRFVLRDPAAQRTLAGGRVIDPFGPARGRASERRRQLLSRLNRDDTPEASLSAWLDSEPAGVNLDRFRVSFNLDTKALAQCVGSQAIIQIPTDRGRLGLRTDRVETLNRQLVDGLDAWHRERPDSLGLTEPELARQAGWRLVPELRRALLTHLLKRGALVRSGFHFHRPGHLPTLDSGDQAALDATTDILNQAGLRPPILGELADRLGQDKADCQRFLERMQSLGLLVRVAANRYFL
ncbi:MAG TPA: selenocysteine-specific translation elongation factor, partial [Alcanivorax sp.]|nr:selenocysteine-specific translation elongation factor [Alcanivorax sp.]